MIILSVANKQQLYLESQLLDADDVFVTVVTAGTAALYECARSKRSSKSNTIFLLINATS
jgi:hypothetical protein